jgi:hypothetical protein
MPGGWFSILRKIALALTPKRIGTLPSKEEKLAPSF